MMAKLVVKMINFTSGTLFNIQNKNKYLILNHFSAQAVFCYQASYAVIMKIFLK